MKTHHMAAYGLLAMPLAFAGLPLYVYAPKFYTDHFGLTLGLMGALLIVLRAIDAVQDPLIGYLSARFANTQEIRRRVMRIALVVMVAGFAMLFHPRWAGPMPMSAWFTLSLFITFTAYSVALVNYYAYAAALTREYYAQATLSEWREASGLIGILLASAIPALLTIEYGELTSFGMIGGILAVIAGTAVLAQLLFADVPAEANGTPDTHMHFRDMWWTLTGNRDFMALAGVYLASSLAAGIPATVVLFYVQDIIRAPSYAGLFLACYFLTGALSMPLWNHIIHRVGKKRAWLASMLLAVVSFAGAFLLGPGDIVLFATACALSGFALGADIAIPPAMLADTLKQDEDSAQYFGVWAFIAKLGLALASGVSLLALGAADYMPGAADTHGKFMLAAVYALVPCAFKLLAALMLWRSKLDSGFEEKRYAFS